MKAVVKSQGHRRVGASVCFQGSFSLALCRNLFIPSVPDAGDSQVRQWK